MKTRQMFCDSCSNVSCNYYNQFFDYNCTKIFSEKVSDCFEFIKMNKENIDKFCIENYSVLEGKVNYYESELEKSKILTSELEEKLESRVYDYNQFVYSQSYALKKLKEARKYKYKQSQQYFVNQITILNHKLKVMKFKNDILKDEIKMVNNCSDYEPEVFQRLEREV